jgi:TonB family protein
MPLKSIAFLAWLACAGSAFADAAASAPAAARTSRASLDNTHCDAYRVSTMAIRSPKDQGVVVLRLEISPQGEVLASEIAERTTSNYFAHVVQESFSKCRFRPARENGEPVAGHAVPLRLVFGGELARKPNNAECPGPSSRETPPSAGAMVATRLRIRFLAEGHVATVDVVQSSGVPALDEAAVNAFRQCHFDPSASGQPAFQEEWVTTVNWSS